MVFKTSRSRSLWDGKGRAGCLGQRIVGHYAGDGLQKQRAVQVSCNCLRTTVYTDSHKRREVVSPFASSRTQVNAASKGPANISMEAQASSGRSPQCIEAAHVRRLSSAEESPNVGARTTRCCSPPWAVRDKQGDAQWARRMEFRMPESASDNAWPGSGKGGSVRQGGTNDPQAASRYLFTTGALGQWTPP